MEESRKLRMEQIAEIQENKDFRSQTLELQRSGARQIQKILKETGILHTLIQSADKANYTTLIERQKIRLLRYIPTYNYTASLRRARALRCEGTCSWLLNRSEFQTWVDQTGPKHLWCHGIRKAHPNHTWCLYAAYSANSC